MILERKIHLIKNLLYVTNKACNYGNIFVCDYILVIISIQVLLAFFTSVIQHTKRSRVRVTIEGQCVLLQNTWHSDRRKEPKTQFWINHLHLSETQYYSQYPSKYYWNVQTLQSKIKEEFLQGLMLEWRLLGFYGMKFLSYLFSHINVSFLDTFIYFFASIFLQTNLHGNVVKQKPIVADGWYPLKQDAVICL